MTESSSAPGTLPPPGTIAGNLGEALKLSGLELQGLSAETAQGGGTIKVYTRLSLTSDDSFFHRAAEGLRDHIEHVARKSGHHVSMKSTNHFLLVMHPDGTGELWCDTAAITLQILPKRSIEFGTAVFEADIVDVTGMAFPLVPIGKEDRVVCIFREGWRFGLFFDMNPQGDFSVPRMQRDLGTLHRRMAYAELYATVADATIFPTLLAAGWFPFAEIMPREFQGLAKFAEAGLLFDELETKLLSAFDEARVERMFSRWMTKPHFAGKEIILRAAQRAFVTGDAVAVLKISLTEIEGILADAYRSVHGKDAKIKELLEFAVGSAEAKAGRPDTLLMAAAFAKYLQSHTFAKFDPVAKTGHAGSRHAVGHGAAAAETYTMVRALQALLTLDQLAFYT